MAYPLYPLHSNTERGVSSLRWSLLLALALQALAAVTLIPVGYVLLNPPSIYDNSTLALLPMLLTIILLGIVAMVFFLSGLSRLHAGRDEYGPVHARNAETAVVFTLIAFVVGIPGAMFGGPYGIAFGSIQGVGLVMTGALSAARGLFVGLAFVYAVRALVRPGEEHVGLFATIALAAGPAVGAGVMLLLLPGTSPYLSSSTLVIPLSGLGVEGAIELFGYILLFRQYTSVSNRLRSGELPPMYRPPIPYVPYFPPYSPYGMPFYPGYPTQPASPYPAPAPAPQPAPPPTPPQQRPAQPPQP
jgi:hypothetical protein